MIIYFALAFVILLYGVYIRPYINERRKKRFIIFSFGLLIIVACLRANNLGIDLAGHYARRYVDITNYSWSNLSIFSKYTGYELGYCYFTKFLTLISADVRFYIIITSLIMYGTTAYFIYSLSNDVVLSTELFVLYCLYYMYMTMIRQGLAVCVVLIGYLYLRKSERKIKNYIIFGLFVFLASTFHSSAILCLVMILFDHLKFTRKQLLVGLLGTAIFYVLYERFYLIVLQLFGTAGHYGRYINSVSEGVGNINRQTIFCLLITAGAFVIGFYEFVWKKRKKENSGTSVVSHYNLAKEESFLLYMGLMATVCRLMIFQMNIINRFSYYFVPFMLILYPNAINQIPRVKNRVVVRRMVYFVFVVYFVWMTVVYASAFYGTVPYQSMFQ